MTTASQVETSTVLPARAPAHLSSVGAGPRGEVDEIGYTDSATFWQHASRQMFRTSFTVVLFKVGLTLVYCGWKGTTIRLHWMFVVIPRFDLGLDEAGFVRVVTLSAWLGALGMILSLAVAEVRRLRLHRRWRNSRFNEEASLEEQRFNEWVTDAARLGIRTGALAGSLTLLFSILAELIRDRVFGTYIWAQPHILVLVIAGLPLLALIGMGVAGVWEARTDRTLVLPTRTINTNTLEGGPE